VKGDAIGVVTPSYTPKAPWLLRGVKSLEHAGFEVVLDPEITDSRRFKRVDDERRAENFMSGWLDPRVKAVVAATGGYGATRMIPHLEADVFRKNPKPFVGYSDVTALHLWMMKRVGLRTFHGPTVDDLIPTTRDATMVSFIASLTTPRSSARASRAWCGRAPPPAGSPAAISRSCSRASARRTKWTRATRSSSSRRRAIP
jgi:muramoyltetrapeptide carboxypeptidase